MTARRTSTEELAHAVRSAGLLVTDVEHRLDPQDGDIIRLSGDQYLSLDYEYFEREGLLQVSLNESMPAGGDPEYASWQLPPTTLNALALALCEH